MPATAAAAEFAALFGGRIPVTLDDDFLTLVRAIVEEAVAVGTAAGAFPTGFDMSAAMARLDALPQHSATSMQLDRRNSRPLEHEYLTGAIITAADRHGIDIPNIRVIHALISAISAHPSTVLESAA